MEQLFDMWSMQRIQCTCLHMLYEREIICVFLSKNYLVLGQYNSVLDRINDQEQIGPCFNEFTNVFVRCGYSGRMICCASRVFAINNPELHNYIQKKHALAYVFTGIWKEFLKK